MNILICSSYKYSAWNSVRPEGELFIGLAQAGHHVIICTQDDAKYTPRFKEFGINVIDCYPTKKICFKTIKKIHQILIEENIDICYGFNSRSIPNIAFAAIGTKAKVVAYRGTTGGLYRHDPSAYLTQLHPRINGIVCVAQAVTDDVKKRVWKNKDNVVTIYKGHNLDWYQVASTNRAEFHLKDDDVIAIFAAHVRPSKGLSVLLEAIKNITSPKFHLLLAGKGYEAYENEINISPLKDRIHLIGQRADVPSLMAMADLQVQPSISGEGLPRTVIEAMANKTPSVVTTTGGAPELVIDGETGYIVNINDIKSFSTAMNKLIDNKNKRINMGEKAQQYLNNKFSSKQTVNQHIAFFKKLLSN